MLTFLEPLVSPYGIASSVITGFLGLVYGGNGRGLWAAER
jgi:hypothetical protein